MINITFIPMDPIGPDFAYRNITVETPPEAPSASACERGSTSQKPGISKKTGEKLLKQSILPPLQTRVHAKTVCRVAVALTDEANDTW